MNDIILYLLLSIIAICLIAIVYYFSKLSKNKEADVSITDEQPTTNSTKNNKFVSTNPHAIPDDVAFNNKNLPYRTSRSTKRKINYGKDFNAYLVKGGTIYHKKSCKKLSGKKVVIKHIYECIADKNKKACPYCKPRTKIHEWYADRFPDSIFVQSAHSQEPEEEFQISLFDTEYNNGIDNIQNEQIESEI